MFQVSAFLLLLSYCQCHAAEVTVQKDIDMSKFVGQWYGIAAASNCPMFQKMKTDMTLPIIVYSLDKDNNIKFSVAFKTPKGCQQMDAVYETITSGHYRHNSKHGDNEVIIVGTDYTGFALEYTKTVHENNPCISLKLYGRGMNMPDDVEHRFMEFSNGLGLKKDDTVVFSKGEQCVPHAV